MRREFVHYVVSQKSPRLSQAILRGFGARGLAVERAAFEHRPGRVHLVCGLQFGALELLQQIRAAGADYVFFDRAYFGGGPGSGVYRATLNGYQQHWVRPEGPARPLPALRSWRTRGEHVLLVPPGPAVCRLFGLGDWEVQISARLRLLTQRWVRVTYKGDPVPLAERLQGCHAVVTWSSNVAVDAIVAGVPAFVGPEAAALPAAKGLAALEAELEDPWRGERGAWATSLAQGQFSLDEIRNGFCREVLGL